MTEDVWQRSAVRLAADIRDETDSPIEVVEAVFDRIEERNSVTNSFVTVTAERAREQARDRAAALESGDEVGPLHGVPVAIKDLTPIRDVRYTRGAKPLADAVATRTDPVVERLEAAGAVVVGKTNTPEFGHKATTDNRLCGPTRNPFDTDLNAGGSSGGSAAAVADGLVPIAHGTDGGGSIRIPAAFCGLFGLKPSYGRIPLVNRPSGFCTHTPMLHHGPITRTVADAALMLEVMVGPHPRDPFCLPEPDRPYQAAVQEPADEFRVAYSPDFDVFPVEADVRRVVSEAVDAFDDVTAGAATVDVDHGRSREEIENAWRSGRELDHAMTADSLRERGVDLLEDHRDQLPQELVDMMTAGFERSGVSVRRTDVVRTDVFDAVEDLLADYNFLVMPTLGTLPFENGVLGPEEVDGVAVDPALGWRPTFQFNLTGHPVASVPAGFADGLPVGLQLVGRRWADGDVLAAAAAFERARPWHDRYPFVEA